MDIAFSWENKQIASVMAQVRSPVGCISSLRGTVLLRPLLQGTDWLGLAG